MYEKENCKWCVFLHFHYIFELFKVFFVYLKLYIFYKIIILVHFNFQERFILLKCFTNELLLIEP